MLRARRGESVEDGGRSGLERLSCTAGLPVVESAPLLRRTIAPTTPINRIASARPTCVSRFMFWFSGRPALREAMSPGCQRVQLWAVTSRRDWPRLWDGTAQAKPRRLETTTADRERLLAVRAVGL